MTKNIDKNTVGILVMSHGLLCEGLLNSAAMIGADMDTNVFALPFLEDTDIPAYTAEALEYLSQMPEGSIVLFDLFSGTPFNQLVQACFAQNIDLHALCGVNLPILLEACTMRECMAGEELIETLRASGESSLVNVGAYVSGLRAQMQG